MPHTCKKEKSPSVTDLKSCMTPESWVLGLTLPTCAGHLQGTSWFLTPQTAAAAGQDTRDPTVSVMGNTMASGRKAQGLQGGGGSACREATVTQVGAQRSPGGWSWHWAVLPQVFPDGNLCHVHAAHSRCQDPVAPAF